MKFLPRMYDWIIVTIILSILIYVLAPQQLPVTLYKLSLITTAAVLGYWIDRSLFPYARPDGYLALSDRKPWQERVQRPVVNDADIPVADGYQRVFAASMLRRAIIIGCAMLAMSLGV